MSGKIVIYKPLIVNTKYGLLSILDLLDNKQSQEELNSSVQGKE